LSTTHKHTGAYALRLRYNKSSSIATTDTIDLSGYTRVTIDYWYAESGMDGGDDDFMIEYLADKNSTWKTAQTIVPNAGNGVWENQTVVIDDTFTATTQFRIRHSAGSSDYTYFDDITISGCNPDSEQCDDGNTINGDGCENDCSLSC
jgi:cysteine-rich repeat protein